VHHPPFPPTPCIPVRSLFISGTPVLSHLAFLVAPIPTFPTTPHTNTHPKHTQTQPHSLPPPQVPGPDGSLQFMAHARLDGHTTLDDRERTIRAFNEANSSEWLGELRGAEGTEGEGAGADGRPGPTAVCLGGSWKGQRGRGRGGLGQQQWCQEGAGGCG
jgi:hypothetical protein